MGDELAEQYGRRNAVESELLSRLHRGQGHRRGRHRRLGRISRAVSQGGIGQLVDARQWRSERRG